MECPRCGFSQPQDLFCARCGAHIPTVLRARRKRIVITLVVTGVVFAVGLASLLIWLKPWSRPVASRSIEEQEQRDSIPKVSPSPPPPPLPTEASKKQLSKKKGKSRQGQTSQEIRKEPPRPQEEKPQPQEPQEWQLELLRWAAQEWMEKAREFEGDLPKQAEMYTRALEVYPDFAPAHYHLGLIRLKEGNKDLAQEHFRKFISLAKQAEREALPIPEDLAQELLGHE